MLESATFTQIYDSTDVLRKPEKDLVKEEGINTFKVYRKRWLILFLFFFYAFSNLMQAYGYAVVNDLLVKFYGVSYVMAEWSTTSGFVIQSVVLIPGSYVLDKLGIKRTVIIGIIGTTVGSWIKVVSAEQSRFWVFFLGKSVVSLFQVFIATLPTKLAGVWFANDQVSTACFIALIESEFSYSLGMFTVAWFVSPGTIVEIGTGLQNFAYFSAIFSSILIPILIIFFSNAPPTKPSIAQVTSEELKAKNVWKSLKIFLTNRSFMVFLVSFGITIGILQAIVLNSSQIIAYYHPDDSVNHLGNVMVVCTVGGMIGALPLGLILDKFACFKLATICLFISVTVFSILHIQMMMFDVRILYGTAFLLGLNSLPMYSIGYSIAVELTHPEPECVAGTILQVVMCLISIGIAHLHSFLFTAIGPIWSNIALYLITIFGTLLLFGVKFDLKRQKTESGFQLKG